VNRVISILILILLFIPTSGISVLAYDQNETGSSVVSATVVGTTFNPPVLVSPNNNSTTNNTRQPLIWQRPSPLPSTPLHHYDIYLDGTVFAYSISDSITTPQTYYFYTTRRDNDTFYLEFLTDLTQGYHTWSVTAYDTTGISAASETRTFYIDSVAPYILLEKIDKKTLNWNTSVSGSIPDINLRDIQVTNANPLLNGKVEAYANLQITLICPQNIPNCTNQSYLGNYPTGIWQHRFYGLIKGLIYTVHLSTTDAGGNSIIFPEYYLAYGIVTPSPIATTTPIISPTQTELTTPTPEIEVPPSVYTPTPPTAPTPPLFQNATLVSTKQKTANTLLILLAIGLPLHLIMTVFGAGIRFTSILKFLFILFFPFIGKKEYQTVPFTTIDLYNPEKLNSIWQSKISDIRGYYSLTSPLIDKIFVKIYSFKRYWKNIIINCEILSQSCLFPIPYDTRIPSNWLQNTSMSLRSIPLILALATSGISLILSPNYFYLLYLYLSLHLVFSEYIYPNISK